MATEARAGEKREAGFGNDRGGQGSLDGFSLQLPTRNAVGKQRGSGKQDFSIFTLDYAFRKVGGRKAAVELARLASSNDERLRGLVSGFDSLTPGQRKHRPRVLEELCINNGLDPSEFLGICTAVAHRYQLDTSSIVASVELEKIVETGVEMAKKPEGFRDRQLIMEHAQFLPQKGPGVAIQVNNTPQVQGTPLPEFRSLSEIALGAIAKAALPPAPEEKKEVSFDAYVDADPVDAVE